MTITEELRAKNFRRCRYCGALITDDWLGALHEFTCTKKIKLSKHSRFYV